MNDVLNVVRRGRMKGVLAMAGVAEKFVYQGVHMQFKVHPSRRAMDH